jgi:hypothetical protein
LSEDFWFCRDLELGVLEPQRGAITKLVHEAERAAKRKRETPGTAGEQGGDGCPPPARQSRGRNDG